MKSNKTFLILSFILLFFSTGSKAQIIENGCYVASESRVYTGQNGNSTNFENFDKNLPICIDERSGVISAIITEYTTRTCTIVGTGGELKGVYVNFKTVQCPIDDYIPAVVIGIAGAGFFLIRRRDLAI